MKTSIFQYRTRQKEERGGRCFELAMPLLPAIIRAGDDISAIDF